MERGLRNAREQGAKGENVKGTGNKDPPNKASALIQSYSTMSFTGVEAQSHMYLAEG